MEKFCSWLSLDFLPAVRRFTLKKWKYIKGLDHRVAAVVRMCVIKSRKKKLSWSLNSKTDKYQDLVSSSNDNVPQGNFYLRIYLKTIKLQAFTLMWLKILR